MAIPINHETAAPPMTEAEFYSERIKRVAGLLETLPIDNFISIDPDADAGKIPLMKYCPAPMIAVKHGERIHAGLRRLVLSEIIPTFSGLTRIASR